MILTYPDDRLRAVCPPVDPDDITSPWFIERSAELVDALAKAGGFGLAGPQIGWLARVFVWADADTLAQRLDRVPCMVLVNPRIVEVTGQPVRRVEGCLSFPGLTEQLTMREDCVVRWLGTNGKEHQSGFTEMDGRCAQHEVDHLDGKLFIDRMGPLTRRMFMKRYAALRRRTPARPQALTKRRLDDVNATQ